MISSTSEKYLVIIKDNLVKRRLIVTLISEKIQYSKSSNDLDNEIKPFDLSKRCIQSPLGNRVKKCCWDMTNDLENEVKLFDLSKRYIQANLGNRCQRCY